MADGLGRRLRAVVGGLALLLGVAFGNVLIGVPLGADGNIRMSLLDLLSPIPLLIGVTTIAMFAMHGSIYLSMKTDEALQARIKAWLPRLMAVFFVLNTLLIAGPRRHPPGHHGPLPRAAVAR